jgi:hypothetical protein
VALGVQLSLQVRRRHCGHGIDGLCAGQVYAAPAATRAANA